MKVTAYFCGDFGLLYTVMRLAIFGQWKQGGRIMVVHLSTVRWGCERSVAIQFRCLAGDKNVMFICNRSADIGIVPILCLLGLK